MKTDDVKSAIDVVNQVTELRKALVASNGLLRSCFSVVERQGRDTNWSALQALMNKQLEIQRKLINSFDGYGVDGEPIEGLD